MFLSFKNLTRAWNAGNWNVSSLVYTDDGPKKADNAPDGNHDEKRENRVSHAMERLLLLIRIILSFPDEGNKEPEECKHRESDRERNKAAYDLLRKRKKLEQRSSVHLALLCSRTDCYRYLCERKGDA